MERMRRGPIGADGYGGGGSAVPDSDQPFKDSNTTTPSGDRYSGTRIETSSGEGAPPPQKSLSGETASEEELEESEAGFFAGADTSGESGWDAEEAAAVAPGDRFQPVDLLCLAAFHADNGAWSDCLDVLDAAQEVGIGGTSNVATLGPFGIPFLGRLLPQVTHRDSSASEIH